MIQHILYATDGSFASEHAGDYVASLAIRFHAKVTVLHAFTQLPVPIVNYNTTEMESYEDEKDANALAQKTAERLRKLGVVDVETEVVSGQPAHVILGVAESIKPDIIVIGARGLSTWQGILLGSVSMSVTQRAEVPVLVVK
jgi:nucleotide-binding universal stress UspA family protein